MKKLPIFTVSMYIETPSTSPRKLSLGPETLLDRVYIPRDFRIVSLSLGLGGNHYQMVNYQEIADAIFDSKFSCYGTNAKIYEVNSCKMRLSSVIGGYSISNIVKREVVYNSKNRISGFYSNGEFVVYIPTYYKFIADEMFRFLSQTKLYFVLSDYGISIAKYSGI